MTARSHLTYECIFSKTWLFRRGRWCIIRPCFLSLYVYHSFFLAPSSQYTATTVVTLALTIFDVSAGRLMLRLHTCTPFPLIPVTELNHNINHSFKWELTDGQPHIGCSHQLNWPMDDRNVTSLSIIPSLWISLLIEVVFSAISTVLMRFIFQLFPWLLFCKKKKVQVSSSGQVYFLEADTDSDCSLKTTKVVKEV